MQYFCKAVQLSKSWTHTKDSSDNGSQSNVFPNIFEQSTGEKWNEVLNAMKYEMEVNGEESGE